jgi:hypothetical protein
LPTFFPAASSHGLAWSGDRGSGFAFGTKVRVYRRIMCNEQTQSAGADAGSAELAWVPQSCTLPSVEQPLRIAEFDGLFASSLRDVQRLAATRLRLMLDPGAEAVARDLTARESECCSFFTFIVTPVGGELHVDVEVPAAHVAVLDALATRAAAQAASAA